MKTYFQSTLTSVGLELTPVARRQSMSLNARVALVTGAGSGIGKAIALVLAERGADIAVTGRRLERLDETANTVRGLGRRALAVSADVAVADQVRHMVKETVGEFGRIDI